jgi:P-type Ca2+ transporter type 2C
VAIIAPTDAAPSGRMAIPDAAVLRPAEVATRLRVDVVTGLSVAEVEERRRIHGSNQLEPPQHESVIRLLVASLTQPFVIVLGLAGLLAVVLGEVRDGLLILVGLAPIVGADVVTEYRAERALEALEAAAAPTAVARRDGVPVEVPARELVPGDVVLLRVGDVVPADVRIVHSDALTLDRSILTGESLPEPASADADPVGTVLADRRSMAYAGTSVVLGRGEGLAVATGTATELGRIAGALGDAHRGRAPLQRELDRLIRILLVVAIGLIVVTVSLAIVRGATPGEAVIAGISAAIAAIPEEPPVLLAVILGLGAYRLLRRGVLVRRLNAQETLGAVDLILTDKTGTLTENQLTLERIVTLTGPVEEPVRRRAMIAEAVRAEEDAWRSGNEVRMGSFTRALLAAGGPDLPALDPADLDGAIPPGDRQPYSLTRVRRSGIIEERALGAPEAVLALGPDDAARHAWHEVVEANASAGRRLLLLSSRCGSEPWRPLAILSFTDRLRDGIQDALRVATEAGIQTLVVTGDHPTTAAAIARAAGLPADRVLTGPELDAMDDPTLEAAIGGLHVVARATPEQKLRLVQAAKAAQRTVAVTGDGVNDAPALHRADVGVAMGSGTAVAREAADLVLGDDSFVTLLAGLAEGRRIVANVQKGLVFLTSTHVALLGFIFLATVVGFTQPLLPIQILWLELFIDLSTSVAFEREPAEPDVMRRPPRPRGVPLLTTDLLVRMTLAGGVTALAALAILSREAGGLDHARWVAFTLLVLGQLVRAYANRSLTLPIHRLAPNGFLALACITAAAIQLAIPFVPPLAEAFRASPLGLEELGLVALIALAPAVLAELIRTFRHTVWVA